MIQDAYLRQNQPQQRLYWSGPRGKWADVAGERTLPTLRNQLPNGLVDPRDKSGLIINRWMVDEKYVEEVMGEEGKSWCDRLFQNPTFQPPVGSDDGLRVLRRPEFSSLLYLYNSWASKIVLSPDHELPSADEMMQRLESWEADIVG